MKRILTHPSRTVALLFAFAVALTVVVGIGAPAEAGWAKNCTKVNLRYPSGIGRTTAVDVTTDATPVTTFTRSNKLFKKVKKLDTDRDKIACERNVLPSTAGACPFAADAVDAMRTAILDSTNQYRASYGLRPLQLTVALDQLAQDWSTQMANAGVQSHRPNFWTYYPAGWITAAENVGEGPLGTTAQEMVTAWINSPNHRANLLSDSNCLGLGYVQAGSGRRYFTQNFGQY